MNCHLPPGSSDLQPSCRIPPAACALSHAGFTRHNPAFPSDAPGSTPAERKAPAGVPVAATRKPIVEQVQIAEESYRRCQGEQFFQAFYRRLLASDPSIPPKFAETDFDRQN